MATPVRIASILAGVVFAILCILSYFYKELRDWVFLFIPIIFFIRLLNPGERAKLKEPVSPLMLLVGLSLPAILLTNGEIIAFGKPLLFISINAMGVTLIAMLALLRDKRAANARNLKDL
jgi:hypothetical protein